MRMRFLLGCVVATSMSAQAETAYVQSSVLTVRAAPAVDAVVVDKLKINSKLDRGALANADFVAVTLANGKTGFAAARFLDVKPLQQQDAIDKSNAASTAAEALEWLQRAAAMQEDVDVLRALEVAYGVAGDRAAADKTRGRWRDKVRFLDVQKPVDSEGKVVPGNMLAVLMHPHEPNIPVGEAPASKWAELGIRPLENGAPPSIWLLHADGRASKATIKAVTKIRMNHCRHGTLQLLVAPDASLPPVAMASFDPPASWLSGTSSWTGRFDEAAKAIKAHMRAKKIPPTTPFAVGKQGSFALHATDCDDEPTCAMITTISGDATDKFRASKPVATDVTGITPQARALVDVNGDGMEDRVLTNGKVVHATTGAVIVDEDMPDNLFEACENTDDAPARLDPRAPWRAAK
jgi:hypothetical protein